MYDVLLPGPLGATRPERHRKPRPSQNRPKRPPGSVADSDQPKPAKAPAGSEDGNGHSKPTKNSVGKERAGKEE
jgi:hypothetical protein